MYIQLMVSIMTMVLLNPTGHSSHQTQIHPLMNFIKYIKPNMVDNLSHLIWISEGSSQKSTPSAPNKPFKKYDGPVYATAEVYKLLSPDAVAALKKYNTEAINKSAKKRGIHVTNIANHEPSPSEDTSPEHQPDP